MYKFHRMSPISHHIQWFYLPQIYKFRLPKHQTQIKSYVWGALQKHMWTVHGKVSKQVFEVLLHVHNDMTFSVIKLKHLWHVSMNKATPSGLIKLNENIFLGRLSKGCKFNNSLFSYLTLCVVWCYQVVSFFNNIFVPFSMRSHLIYV